MNLYRPAPALLLLAATLLFADHTAFAQMPLPAAPRVGADHYVLMDAATGDVLVERDAETPVEPASLTKLMTAYVVFKAIEEGRVSLEDMVTISQDAWIAGGGIVGSRERRNVSTMYAREGSQISVQDLLKGMIIVSGNDASVALAERVAGSEAAFADLMNHYAARLGMVNSHFVNSHGLPAEGHISSAGDMARLAQAIISGFPDLYAYYSQRRFDWDGTSQPNRNGLLGVRVGGAGTVDGMKTGYTAAARYCLVTSAADERMRLISVIMGSPSVGGRERASRELLSYGFNNFETHTLYRAGEEVTRARLWRGREREVALGVAEDVTMLVPRGRRDHLQADLDLPRLITAPLPAERPLGQLTVRLEDEALTQVDLYPLEDMPEGSFWQRTRDAVLLWFE